MRRFSGAKVPFLAPILTVVLSVVVTACGEESASGPVDPMAALLAASAPMMDVASGEDPWEVLVCRVPRGVTDPMYAPLDDRMEHDAAEIVDLLAPVTEYYRRWSGGRYELRFEAAPREVSILADETSQQCVDRALEQSSPTAAGVLVVADAQHAEDAEGGRGGPGTPCAEDCPARTTRRFVYVGAADFMPVWEDAPPLDLVEHELGHALDWPHSSLSADGLDEVRYDSPYDLMSDSTASRRVDDGSRHGPGILAVNLMSVGWIDRVESWRRGAEASVVELNGRSDHASDGPMLVLLAIDDTNFYSVELISATGDDAFHGSDLVLVHRIEIVGSVGFDRRQYVASSPLRAGDEWTADGFVVRVSTMGEGRARIEISGDA